MTDTRLRETPKQKPTAWQSVLDIVTVAGVSALFFLLETWARDTELVSWGEASRGVTAVLAGAAAAVGLVYLRGGRLRDLGLVRPRSWWTVPLWVVGILAVWLTLQLLVPRLIGLFVEIPEPDFSRYAEVAGNLRAALIMALLLPFTASIPEEIVYRGFLINRLESIFGRSRAGAIAAVVVQSLIFGSIHFSWGLGGMVFTTLMGATWATAYMLCGRNLWIMIIAHSTGHLLFVTQLYGGSPG
jgi:membrane protease YdiL (CAAX protease family)